LLIALTAAGAGAPAEHAPRHTYSLISASWPDDEVEPPCGPGVICDIFVTKVAFAGVATVAGPRIPQSLTLFLGWHGMLPPREHFLAAAWWEKGRWHARWEGDFDEEGCVSTETFSYYRISVPSEGYRKDDRICFRR
jgi:hypothetical protein